VTLSNPLDVAKTRLQAGNGKDAWGTLKGLWNQEGMTGMSKGLPAKLPRNIIGMAFFRVIEKQFRSYLEA
jgi:hypothetical protein